MGFGAAAPQSDWGATSRWLHDRLRGLPWDGAARGLLLVDLHRASLVGGEATQDRAGWGLRLAEEVKAIRLLPRVLPLRLQPGVAQGVVLHQEPSGGAIRAIHRKKAREAGELVVGPRQSAEEEPRDYRGGALEAGAVGTRWGAGVPHLLPPLGCPAGREDVADVDVQWPDGS